MPAMFIFALLKDRAALLFTLVTASFFVFGTLIYDELMRFDKGVYIYRYLVWAFTDLSWMALIAYLALKDKLYMWQSMMGQLLVFPAPLLQLWRVADRHLWDFSFHSTYLYKVGLPVINIATVVLCYLPIIIYLKKLKSHKA